MERFARDPATIGKVSTPNVADGDIMVHQHDGKSRDK